MRKFQFLIIFVSILFLSSIGCEPENSSKENMENTQFWLTDPGRGIQFKKQSSGFSNDISIDENAIDISIQTGMEYQEMDGFGFALTGGSAYHLYNMSDQDRKSILNECFGQGQNSIGISYLRVSIGASDLDETVFSYNDLPSGETDIDLENFSIDEDRKHLIPVLKEILEIAPDIKILGSPWSPPVWMKTNGSSIGGSLKTEYHESYAQYFVKYIQSMAEEGITIDAITIQNEPLHPGNNPSCYMPATQQKDFIKGYLGPAFLENNISTKIIIWDHNADNIEYPISILNDPDAKQYIDGSAFHLYGGNIDNLSDVHAIHPDKNLYFTEQWIGAPGNFSEDLKWHTRNLIVGATRNWCKVVLQWNFAADENQDPHTPGGCTSCLGGLTITGNSVIRNPAYYIIAHASKFVRPGFVRIESTRSSTLPNVAFKDESGNVVIIVLNDLDKTLAFNFVLGDTIYSSSLNPGAVGTFVINK